MEAEESFEKFRDEAFLAVNTLSPANATEYFCNSGFFDPQSLNQQRRKGLTIPQDADGIEYRLTFCNSAGRNEVDGVTGGSWNYPNTFGLFVIQKFRREKGQETPMECYYILGGTVYKAPSLAAIIRHRLSLCLTSIEKIVDETGAVCKWSLTNGYGWAVTRVEATGDDDQQWIGDSSDDDDNDNMTNSVTPIESTNNEVDWSSRWRLIAGLPADEEEVERQTQRPKTAVFRQEDHPVLVGDAQMVFSARTKSQHVDRVLGETFTNIYKTGVEFGESVTRQRQAYADELAELTAELASIDGPSV